MVKILKANKIEIHFIDNTPDKVCDYLNDLSQNPDNNLKYTPLKNNLGIATAQNIGINNSIEKKDADFFLFLDQDSSIEEGFVNKMVEEYTRIEKLGVNIAALGPTIINKDNLLSYKQEKKGKDQNAQGFYTPSVLISSGMLIQSKILKQVGLMEDELFIDAVDFEWCWRAKFKGYDCCLTERVKMNHKVGIEDKKFLGQPILISSPKRYFYQYRNFLLLVNRSYVPTKWKIKNFIRKFFLLIYIPITTKHGFKSLNFMLSGIKEGCKNLIRN